VEAEAARGDLREELSGQASSALRAAVQERLGAATIASASEREVVDAFRAAYTVPRPLDETKLRAVGRRAWRIGFDSLAVAAEGRKRRGWLLRLIGGANLLARFAGARVLPGGRRARRLRPRFKLPRLNPFHG
jgi:hypothetical protein